MKKLSLVLAGVLLVGGISFAQTAPAQKAAPVKTEKKAAKADKKAGKAEKKAGKADKKAGKAEKKAAK